jgi:hypothetical protein
VTCALALGLGAAVLLLVTGAQTRPATWVRRLHLVIRLCLPIAVLAGLARAVVTVSQVAGVPLPAVTLPLVLQGVRELPIVQALLIQALISALLTVRAMTRPAAQNQNQDWGTLAAGLGVALVLPAVTGHAAQGHPGQHHVTALLTVVQLLAVAVWGGALGALLLAGRPNGGTVRTLARDCGRVAWWATGRAAWRTPWWPVATVVTAIALADVQPGAQMLQHMALASLVPALWLTALGRHPADPHTSWQAPADRGRWVSGMVGASFLLVVWGGWLLGEIGWWGHLPAQWLACAAGWALLTGSRRTCRAVMLVHSATMAALLVAPWLPQHALASPGEWRIGLALSLLLVEWPAGVLMWRLHRGPLSLAAQIDSADGSRVRQALESG